MITLLPSAPFTKASKSRSTSITKASAASEAFDQGLVFALNHSTRVRSASPVWDRLCRFTLAKVDARTNGMANGSTDQYATPLPHIREWASHKRSKRLTMSTGEASCFSTPRQSHREELADDRIRVLGVIARCD